MANHKGAAECITCTFHEIRGARVFCAKYDTDIPSEAGPYLICRLWQGMDGKTLDPGWKDKYLPKEDLLYQFEVYMPNAAKVIKNLR